MTYICAVVLFTKDQGAQHPFYQWVNLGEGRGKIHCPPKALGVICEAGTSVFGHWHPLSCSNNYPLFLPLLNKDPGSNEIPELPKPVCPASKLRATRFFTRVLHLECWPKQTPSEPTALSELGKLLMKNRRCKTNRRKLTAVPPSKVKSHTLGNREKIRRK